MDSFFSLIASSLTRRRGGKKRNGIPLRRWVFAGLNGTYPLVEVDGVLASNDLLDGGLRGLLSLGRHF